MLMGEKGHTILSAYCFGDVNINKADGVESANKIDPPTMDRDIEHIGRAQDSCINKHEHALVVDNCLDVNLRMDQFIPPASHDRSSSEESTWTQEKKPNIPSPATEEKILIDHKQEQGAGQIQDLDLDDDAIRTQIGFFFNKLNFRPPDDEDFWSVFDEKQLTKVYQRLARYRINAHELLSTGEDLNDAQLNVQFPPDVLQDEGYFERYEKNLEWYFHPEQCQLAGVDDYHRLVLHDVDKYGYWDYYSLTYHPYQGDLEYVQYCDEMTKKIKWARYKHMAFLQSLKIAIRFRNIFAGSVMGGFRDYINSVQFDFTHRKDFDSVYLEIWKRVAKQKMNFNEALKQLYEQNIFPSHRLDIKLALDNYPFLLSASMKDNISEDDAHFLIIEAIKKMFPKQKTYLDYARKKMEISARIGLIPKTSSLEVTTQGGENHGEVKPAIVN